MIVAVMLPFSGVILTDLGSSIDRDLHKNVRRFDLLQASGSCSMSTSGMESRPKMVEGAAEIGVVEFLSSRSFERAIESGGSKFDLHS